ncbi:MAG: isoprenylcysteine carboxylmethyltransferase family protein [Candidatus Omnitrophica bacterium]|nr:isoprenylcysteine carboxylmethyltransferase family protein [Candidatus Omnitrophota bacterium]
MKTFTDRLRRLFKLRFAVLYPAAIYLVGFCNIDDRGLLPGLFLIFLGVLIRLWANCYAVKMDRLTTSGPYAFVRNPLYLGTAVVMLGVVVLLWIYLWGGIFFAVAVLAYYRTILSEQRMLTDKFGEAFLDYMRHVPCLLPRLTPYAKGEKWPFSWQRLWESREHKVAIWLTVAVVAFYVKRVVLVEKETLTAQAWLGIVFAALLIVVDIVGDYLRGHRQHKARA